MFFFARKTLVLILSSFLCILGTNFVSMLPNPSHLSLFFLKELLSLSLLPTGTVIQTVCKRMKVYSQWHDTFPLNLITFIYDNIFSTGESAAGVANINAEKRKLSFFLNDGKSHPSFLKPGSFLSQLSGPSTLSLLGSSAQCIHQGGSAIVSWQFKWGQLVTRVTVWAIVCPLGTGSGRFKWNTSKY